MGRITIRILFYLKRNALKKNRFMSLIHSLKTEELEEK